MKGSSIHKALNASLRLKLIKEGRKLMEQGPVSIGGMHSYKMKDLGTYAAVHGLSIAEFQEQLEGKGFSKQDCAIAEKAYWAQIIINVRG